MSEISNNLPSHAQWAQEQYTATAKKAAQQLREIADKFESTALDFRGSDVGMSMDRYKMTYAASRAINDLHWGIANVNVDTMLNDAGAADAATREDETR
jgi:hypothetical protein